MTGGSCAGDRASPFSTLETWQQKLVMVVIDEEQQYWGDREVASAAMLPHVWWSEQEMHNRLFFVASAFRPVWPGRCDLNFICIPQSTRALDQGGVEPRQAVSPKALRPWTIPLRYSVGSGDAQQTPGGIAQAFPNRHHQTSVGFQKTCPALSTDRVHAAYTLQALMKMVSQLDLPVVADMETMFQLAVTDLGPLWNPTEMSAHRECLDILACVCPDCTLRWDEPTADDVARLPNNIEATIVGEVVNPTTLHLLAHICAALDSVPEWLQWVQAPDTLSAAGAAGDHSWGLMLPTSTRTPGVNYTSSVAVRYPPLNRKVNGQ